MQYTVVRTRQGLNTATPLDPTILRLLPGVPWEKKRSASRKQGKCGKKKKFTRREPLVRSVCCPANIPPSEKDPEKYPGNSIWSILATGALFVIECLGRKTIHLQSTLNSAPAQPSKQTEQSIIQYAVQHSTQVAFFAIPGNSRTWKPCPSQSRHRQLKSEHL